MLKTKNRHVEYQQTSREKKNTKYREWYAKNAEKERLRNKNYRENNKEKINAYQRKWQKKKASKLKLKRQADRLRRLASQLRREQILLISLFSEASNVSKFYVRK